MAFIPSHYQSIASFFLRESTGCNFWVSLYLCILVDYTSDYRQLTFDNGEHIIYLNILYYTVYGGTTCILVQRIKLAVNKGHSRNFGASDITVYCFHKRQSEKEHKRYMVFISICIMQMKRNMCHYKLWFQLRKLKNYISYLLVLHISVRYYTTVIFLKFIYKHRQLWPLALCRGYWVKDFSMNL